MNLIEYKNEILNTSQDDWTVIYCWGYGSGPSYLNRFIVSTKGGGEFENLEVNSFSVVASLKRNLSISIAWGFTNNDDFKEPWANNFPHSHATSDIVDFFYNGVVVFRDILVSVDGGKCNLPLPDQVFDSAKHEVVGYEVPSEKYDFFKILDQLEGRYSNYDRYFDRTGFVIVNKPWME